MSLNTENNNKVEDQIKNEETLHYLSEPAIYYYQATEEKERPAVPPNTPQYTNLNCYVTKTPKIPENVGNIPIPLVREVGIRDSISILAKYFECEDYSVNLAQFWFLDIVVDIIWRCQDEFRFPFEYQRVILNWMMFVMKLVSEKHMTKTKLFLIFREALEIAEEYIQSGCKMPPSPNDLFTLKEEQQLQKSFTSVENDVDSSESTTSVHTRKPSQMCIVIEVEDQILKFKMPRTNNPLVNTIECTSSIESVVSDKVSNLEENDILYGESSMTTLDSENFWKPNWGTPDRFKSLPELKSSSKDSKSSSSSKRTISSENVSQYNGDWMDIKRKPSLPSCPNIIEEAERQELTKTGQIRKNSKDSQKTELSNIIQTPVLPSKKEILKAFYIYNLWKLKNEYMTDPKMGWTPLEKTPLDKNLQNNMQENKDLTPKEKIINYLKAEQETIKELNKIIFINTGVLVAIKDFVIDYFEDDFSFILAKYALQGAEPLWTQNLNTDWNIPKLIKGEVKKPLPKKPKSEKKSKEKHYKGEKKSDKKSKKDKSSKKSDKTTKSTKKEKKHKSDTLSSKKHKSKEQQEEEKRLKKEAEILEKQRLFELENETFMFPLKEAVDEKFFSEIFENYKSKKDKEHKEKTPSDKSSKASKKTK